MNRVNFVCVLILMLLLPAAGCTTATTTDTKKTTAADTLSESRKLASISPAYLSLEKDTSRPQGIHDELLVVAKGGRGSAYIERVDKQYRVVHNGRPGKLYQMVGDLTLSRDGSRVAYAVYDNATFRSIVDNGIQGQLFTEIGMPKFSPDGKHLVYTTREGKEDRLVIDHKLRNEYQVSQSVLISPDSRQIAFASMPPGGGKIDFVITDFTLQDKKVFNSCGESFTASEDTNRIAVVCREGNARSIKIIDFKNRSVEATIATPAEGQIVRARFMADNRSFIFTTMTDDLQRFVFYNGRVEKIPAGDEIMSDPVLLTGPVRLGAMIGNAYKVSFNSIFDKTGYKEKDYGYVTDVIASPDGSHHAYVAFQPSEQERMSIVIDGKEGPIFDKIVSPVFSPDGRFLVYRVRQAGKRFLIVSDMQGKIVRQHKDYDMVFQPVFTDDGKSVAYGVLDGSELWWKVEKL